MSDSLANQSGPELWVARGQYLYKKEERMADSQDTTNALEEAIQQLLDGIKEPYYSLATHMCDEFGRNKADREIHKSLLTFADGLDAQASRLPEDERWKLEGQSRDLRERAAALSNHHAESRTRRALMNKPVAA